MIHLSEMRINLSLIISLARSGRLHRRAAGFFGSEIERRKTPKIIV